MSIEMVTWLRAQIDDDERMAKDGAEGGACWSIATSRAMSSAGVWANDASDPSVPVVYDEGYPSIKQAAHIARHDPARVLREAAAKRAIVDWCDDALPADMHFLDDVTAMRAHAALVVLGHLASAYEDRPDWQEDWRP